MDFDLYTKEFKIMNDIDTIRKELYLIEYNIKFHSSHCSYEEFIKMKIQMKEITKITNIIEHFFNNNPGNIEIYTDFTKKILLNYNKVLKNSNLFLNVNELNFSTEIEESIDSISKNESTLKKILSNLNSLLIHFSNIDILSLKTHNLEINSVNLG